MRKIFLTIAGVTIFSLVLGLPLAALAVTLTIDGDTTLSLPNSRNLTLLDGSLLESILINDDSSVSMDLIDGSTISLQSTDGWKMEVFPEIAVGNCSGTTSSLSFSSASTQTVTVSTTGDRCGVSGSGGGGSGGGGGGGGGGLPATPPSATSVSIDGGNAQTDSVNVTLTLGATNATLMLVSNNSSFSSVGSWEDYVSSKSWILTSDLGTKTVYAKFRSSTGGESTVVSDTISLVAVAEEISGDVTSINGGSASLSDGTASVEVPVGAISGSGTVTISPTTSYTAPSGDDQVVGNKAYDLSMTVGGVSVSTFSQAVTVTLTYESGDVSGLNESTLAIYYWSESGQEWVSLGGTVDTVNNTVTVETTHFTKFVIIGQTATTAEEGDLVTLACSAGAGLNDPCKAVYYLGSDGKRYVFPNEKTYKTWYDDFSTVKEVSAETLASYMIGGNVTYRPGIKLVKIQTNPKVYAVGKDGALHWVSTGSLAEAIYGSGWASMINDIPDAFFVNYTESSDIELVADYDKTAVTNASPNINTDKGL